MYGSKLPFTYLAIIYYLELKTKSVIKSKSKDSQLKSLDH